MCNPSKETEADACVCELPPRFANMSHHCRMPFTKPTHFCFSFAPLNLDPECFSLGASCFLGFLMFFVYIQQLTFFISSTSRNCSTDLVMWIGPHDRQRGQCHAQHRHLLCAQQLLGLPAPAAYLGPPGREKRDPPQLTAGFRDVFLRRKLCLILFPADVLSREQRVDISAAGGRIHGDGIDYHDKTWWDDVDGGEKIDEF